MANRQHTAAMTRVVEEAGRCELCGSRRGLEAHHIIPVVCGGDDREENLICVCQCCHARLTPRNLLTSLGLKKLKAKNEKRDFKIMLYDKIDELLNGGEPAGIMLVFDAIEQM